MGYTLPTDHVPGHLSFLCWNHLFASFGQWLGIWQIQTLGPARTLTCSVISVNVSHQLKKAISPCPVSPLSFGDSQMDKWRSGFENYKMPYKSTQSILSEHLPCAGGSDQEFTVLEKCDRYTCNPGGTTGHMTKGFYP